MKTTTIAFIGLGAMGTPMAANLIAAGFSVRAWSRNPAKAAALKGATACPSPREATEGSNVLITMLSDEAAVESVLVGANGALAGLAPGMIHIGMSTVSLAATRKFADMHTRSGVRYVAAPVFGRPDAAQARLLYIVAGGDLRGVERSAPIFSVLGQETYLHETAEQAMVVKLVGNYLIGATVQALLDASPFGKNCKAYPKADLWHMRSLLFTEKVDFLIGNTYGKYLERDCGTPLIRLGFPIFDRHHHHRFPIWGYQGGLRVLTMLLDEYFEALDANTIGIGTTDYSYDIIR